MSLQVLGRDDLEPDAAELGGGPGEVLRDEPLVEADRLEGLGTGVGGDRGDAHLRHDLQDALAERLDHIGDGLLRRDVGDDAAAHEVLAALHRQVRVHRGCTVADEQCDVVNLAHIAGLDDQADLHAVL